MSDRLTLLQRRFINFYFVNGGNATKAAALAGYKGDDNSLAVTGHDNLRKPKIEAIIKSRLNEEAMSANEALWRTSQIARMDISPYIDHFKTSDKKWLIGVDIERLIDDGHGHLVKSVKHTKDGTNIEFYDKQKALDQIMRYYRIDSPNVSVNIDKQQINIMTEEERVKRVRAIVAEVGPE